MDRYSAANALLIYKQQPQATQLKEFRDWQEDGVKVSKGAKSLSILEPVEYAKKDGSTGIAYNVKKVFDVSQTNGRRPAAPTLDRDPRKLVAIMLDTAPIDVSNRGGAAIPQYGRVLQERGSDALCQARHRGQRCPLPVRGAGAGSRPACHELRSVQPQGDGLLRRLRRLYALPQVRRGCEELRH